MNSRTESVTTGLAFFVGTREHCVTYPSHRPTINSRFSMSSSVGSE